MSWTIERSSTISWVGDVEPFHDEGSASIHAIEAAGIATKFKLFKGGFRGFETILPKADVPKEGIEFQGSAFAEFCGRYV